jgi:uroporphyrinogen decarboxylase
MVENPMSEMELSEIEEYPWPDHDCPASLQGLREQAKKLKEENRYAIVGDIVNSGIFEPSHYLRGFQNFLTDMLADEDIACCIMEGMLKFQCARQEDYLREVGEYLDVVFVGDDLATAESLLMSPDIYRSIVKPYHKKYFDFIKSRTKAKLMFHSCGAIEPLINDLIEVGVDILNPVQVSAKGMDTKLLKEKYDKKICFWGAIDTSRVLPTGTVKDVEDEVRRRIDDLGPSGYVVTAVHDIQADVPPENVAAMYRAVKEYKIQ